MTINLYYERFAICSESAVFEAVVKQLPAKYPDIEFCVLNSVDFRVASLGKFSGADLIIENPENKKYILVTYGDKLRNVIHFHKENGWDIENCVEYLTSSGLHKEDLRHELHDYAYTPISYVCSSPAHEQMVENLYRLNLPKHYTEKPFFRGYLYLFRQYLLGDDRFDVNHPISLHEYFERLSQNKICFNINGAGEICYRDMEILGLGGALFRTTLGVKFHDPLIPNHHYIAIDLSDMMFDLKFFPEYDWYKEQAERTIQRYYEAKKDDEFVRFVAENGRKWYEKNGTIKANADIITKLINISKLW